MLSDIDGTVTVLTAVLPLQPFEQALVHTYNKSMCLHLCIVFIPLLTFIYIFVLL